MTTPKGTQDPSMDEILSSIRQLMATESKRQTPSAVRKQTEEILDLTNLLPDEACSSPKPKDKKVEDSSKKGMRLPAWAENIKMPFPTESQKEKEGQGRKEELFLSRAAAEETAQAIQNLTQVVRQDTPLSASSPLREVDSQVLERQVRELLKPLLKEWLDTNLPVLVKWIVNEQIEKLMHQYGLFSASKK